MISSLELLKMYEGLDALKMEGLANTVVLSGKNGAGKSRLLKLLAKQLRAGKIESDYLRLTLSEGASIDNIILLNYSQFDAPLQSPKEFPTYVLKTAHDNLKKSNFENVNRDAMLCLKYLAIEKNAEQEFVELSTYLSEFLGEGEIFTKKDGAKLYKVAIEDANLSPGQQYLLRVCVALFYYEKSEKDLILVLDEPETHLHPQALWRMLELIQAKFHNAQIWIATHSLALMSQQDSANIWYFKNKKVQKMRSCSQELLDGLIGNDQKRRQLHEFIASPDIFASNKFGIESLCDAFSLPYAKGDVQVEMVSESLTSPDMITIVDYGVGKGRLLEGLAEDFKHVLENLNYYAYDISDEDAETCKQTMSINCVPLEHYTNHIQDLFNFLPNGADAVLLVNVFHEIDPIHWSNVFSDIYKLLKPKGQLILVETEILRQGERAYDCGFLVMTENGLKDLLSVQDVTVKRKPTSLGQIVSYTIAKEDICKVSEDSILQAIKIIGNDSLKHIKEIKSHKYDYEDAQPVLWKNGLQLAFWTHQYANAHLNIEFLTNKINHMKRKGETYNAELK